MKKIIYSLSIFALFLSACQSDLLDRFPYDAASSENMWTSENLADQGVNAIYAALRSDRVAQGTYIFDSWSVSTDCRDTNESMLFNKATTGNSLFSGYWKAVYEGISRANDAIANLGKAPLSEEKRGRLLAESKFLRAYFYYRLNMVYKGVPLYLEPTDFENLTKGRETEDVIWNAVLDDLSACINEPNLPDKYKEGSSDFGRIPKSAAYALRGKVYLWKEDWANAEADFKKVGELGHSLFTGNYKDLFKEANEQSSEMIFSVQNIGISGLGNDISFRYGSRVTFGSCWNTYLPNTDFVDTYECADGKKFNWDDVIPGYSSMSPKERSVFFLRDNMTEDEKMRMTTYGADLSKYLAEGNEERIRAAYDNRDPRLDATIITPYSTYLGSLASVDYLLTLRWPYRIDNAEPHDIRTDTNTKFYYLYRKFVAEGSSEIPNRSYSPIDFPLIRYADVLLNLAEALNEQGKTDEAIVYINQVRNRAGVAPLNSNEYTQVKGQADLRERIRNERRWELAGEGVTVFDEMRWKTWKEKKFFKNAGLKEIWGENSYKYAWAGDHLYAWPIPKAEVEMNTNLSQTPGWID